LHRNETDCKRNFMTFPHVLVTGSSRGIGAAIAKSLDARGAHAIRHGNTPRAGTLAADLSDPSAPQQLWQAALAQAGGTIDVLVNNAGLFEANPLDRSDIAWLDGWEDTLRINLTSAAQLSRFAVRHWLERGVRAHRSYRQPRRLSRRLAGALALCRRQGGMLALHKTIARGYAAKGILSYAITPGFTDTAMAGDYLASRGGPGLLADIPLGRVATPDEIAAIAVFCALDAPPA
jgi:NAD(P)-dependent dehydrogenase (short-subunit alcohol dehydrogenase family)